MAKYCWVQCKKLRYIDTTEAPARMCFWFLEEIFAKILVCASKICYEMPPTHLRVIRQLRLMCHPILAHASKNGFQQCKPSWYSQQDSQGAKSQPCSKQSSNWPFPGNFLAFGACLDCNRHRVMVLGWLKKDSDFRLFQVCHFKNSCYMMLCRLRHEHLLPGNNIAV